MERSRFSQWLASFGLGEFQNPLLTRARPPSAEAPDVAERANVRGITGQRTDTR